VLEVEVSTFEVLKLPLLQAALHNFEAWECEAGAYHANPVSWSRQRPRRVSGRRIGISVSQFLTLCRSLDVGARYQTRIKAFFENNDTLRGQFIASQKAALRAAAQWALLKKDIEPADYRMILSVVDGQIHPQLGGKAVWFRDLSLMKRRMTGCVVFSISERYRYTNEFIVYIPHDLQHPLKRYSSAQMRRCSNASSRRPTLRRPDKDRPLTSGFSVSSWPTPTALTISVSSPRRPRTPRVTRCIRSGSRSHS
jgi:hypothetical protein